MKRLALVLLLALSLTACAQETPPAAPAASTPAVPAASAPASSEVKARPYTADVPPMAMVEGKLYLSTGVTSSMARCGVMDGELTSTVPSDQTPTENDQSNFGAGYGYQRGSRPGTIEILMDGQWWIYGSDWGVTLSAQDVTATSATLVLTQEGGSPTGELQFGSAYALEVWQGEFWQSVPTLTGDPLTWTEVAFSLPLGGRVESNLQWEAYYGPLAPGRYRICKEVMDFRAAGDFDQQLYAAEFELG